MNENGNAGMSADDVREALRSAAPDPSAAERIDRMSDEEIMDEWRRTCVAAHGFRISILFSGEEIPFLELTSSAMDLSSEVSEARLLEPFIRQVIRSAPEGTDPGDAVSHWSVQWLRLLRDSLDGLADEAERTS